MEENLWEVFAYAARYGKQPLSEVMSMTLADLNRFIGAVSKIVTEENAPREG
jgi:hypothetical protein